MNRFGRQLKVIFLLVILALIAGGVMLHRVFYGPNTFSGTKEKTFFVSRGEPFASVVDSLEASGIIRSRALFVFVAKITGGTTRIHIGKYQFGTGISNAELWIALREGRGAALISVTIREGIRSRAQARIFAHTIGIDSARYAGLVYDKSFTSSLGIDAPSLEGYLLPETYSFYWQPDEKEVIKRLVDQFKVFYNDSLKARASSFGWTTPQVMTFASIVEGETVLAEERPIISGVYHNRLRKGMFLEADPTIQFILEDGPRRILYSDLRSDNPYNTYRYKGLPPGPINNPGKSSILAALYPAKHDYLYFVANGKGGHWFSTNFADHLRRVHVFRNNRAKLQSQAMTQARGFKL
jgi:UPF0755 protein